MVNYRQNEQTKKWIIISPKRAKRPGDDSQKKEKQQCPFCYGSEHLTPPEVYRTGEGEENKSGWKVRVVPNKFKITDIHEVIIHSPEHDLDLEDLRDDHVASVFQAYKERYNFYRSEGRVIIFNNTGRGGAESLEHDHSQLTVVSQRIALDSPKIGNVKNVALENDFLTIFCPEFSEWPYEVWFVPKRRDLYFGDINDDEVSSFSTTLKKVVNIVKGEVADLSYNYYIYPGKDWFLRFMPRISVRGGFELATGIMVNIKEPRDVMELIRNSLK